MESVGRDASEHDTQAPGGSDIETLVEREGVNSAKSEGFAPGAKLGRYHVIEQVGAGAMGVVYAAYDPELDRRVALKVLHDQQLAPRRARPRLLREAQAMARLSHRNVVAVHDVGTVDERVYLAMEFVGGVDLRTWLAAGERDRQDVLAAFLQAGEGLAAAHDKGIVHGDFKPANVLIDTDDETIQRVLVTDFGLARANSRDSGASGSSSQDDGQSLPQADAFSAELTEATRLMGTPAYMAPEQFRREAVHAGTDQFNFSVALWESLFGERPFEGEGSALALAVLEGRRRPTPTSPVPARVRRALERGLAIDPNERWPDLRSLLDALHPPTPSRRRWPTTLALVAAGGLVVAGGWRWSLVRAEHKCEAAGEEITAVWNERRRDELERAFAGTGARDSEATANLVSTKVDEWTEGWRSLRVETCQRDDARGGSSDADEITDHCFAQRAQALDATLEVLTEADEAVIDVAIAAISSVPQVELCADASVLIGRAEFRPMTSSRSQRIEWERSLQRAQALRLTNRLQDSLRISAAVIEDPEAPPSVVARGLFEQGATQLAAQNYDDGPKSLEDAYFRGLAHDPSGVSFDAAVEVTRLSQVRVISDKETRMWLRMAEALADPGDAVAQADLERSRLIHAYSNGDYVGAERFARGAAAILERELGPNTLAVAELKRNVGITLNQQGRGEEAVEFNEQAVAMFTASLGEDHMKVARARNTLAQTLVSLGRLEDAERQYRLALDTFDDTRRYGPLPKAMVQTNFAHLLVKRSKAAEAAKAAREAHAARSEALGPYHQFTLVSLEIWAKALRANGQPDDAEGLYREQLQRCKVPSCDAWLRQRYATLLRDRGADREAATLLQAAVESASALDRRRHAAALTDLAAAKAAAGDDEEARKHAREAIELMHDNEDASPTERAGVRATLAEVLLDLGMRDEAEHQLRAALRTVLDAGSQETKLIHKIETLFERL